MIDPESALVPDNAPHAAHQAFGELLVRGPWIISDYFRGDGEKPTVTDAEGREWFPTGDVATIDPDGCVPGPSSLCGIFSVWERATLMLRVQLLGFIVLWVPQIRGHHGPEQGPGQVGRGVDLVDRARERGHGTSGGGSRARVIICVHDSHRQATSSEGRRAYASLRFDHPSSDSAMIELMVPCHERDRC
jgi:hypothetical protein